MADEEEKEKDRPHWDHLNDMLNYGFGSGSRDSMDAFRTALQSGIIGPTPPLAPFEFPAPPQKSKQDIADAKIADLEDRLRREIRGHEQALGREQMLRHEINQLRQEKSDLRIRLDQQMSRVLAAAPEFITKYLKFLIFACHPDRNPGRREAAEVTKALFNLRVEK
jgi:hypothetical protein